MRGDWDGDRLVWSGGLEDSVGVGVIRSMGGADADVGLVLWLGEGGAGDVLGGWLW